MTINFQLTKRHTPTETLDPLARDWVGYDPDASPEDNLAANRGMWVIGARAGKENYVTFSFNGEVVLVAGLNEVLTEDDEFAAQRSNGRARKYLDAVVLSKGDPAHDALIGRPTPGHHNPVTYTADPDSDPTCGCGCGAAVPGSRSFVPGHDQKAVHERISRQWGSTLAFVKWFDGTYGS